MVVENKEEINVSNLKTLGHFLSSALHLEEQFRISVYRDYLDMEDWPIDLKPEVFEKIRQRLTQLIDESAEHEQLLHGLARQYAGEENRNKTKVLRELELMRGFELSARDFYRRISLDPHFKDQNVKDVFQDLAESEQRHADIIQEIVGLVNDAPP